MQQTLRSHKCYSNREISNILGVKKTTVDHWFRTDDCFSIPDEYIWFELKDLLKIETNEFDKSIVEFEWRLGVFEQSERCHSVEGICPTVTCGDHIKIIERN